MCYRKKGSGTIWQRLMHPAALARGLLLSFSLFFPAPGPKNGAVDIRLQIQQDGSLLLLARHRASGRVWWKREQERARHSTAWTQHSTASAVLCFVFLLARGHVVLLIGISREDSRRITNAIQSGDACAHFLDSFVFCLNSLLSLLGVDQPSIGHKQAHPPVRESTMG